LSKLRWFPVVTAFFVTSLIISNIIAVKLVAIGPLAPLPAAIILFPIAYIFGDVLTEVYGYARARQVIWIGFACNLLAVIAIWIAGRLPAVPFWTLGNAYDSAEAAQQAYDAILGFTPRLLLASFVAYLAGEFLNSFVLAQLKLMTNGRYLWARTIGSTLVAQLVDSGVFIPLAFAGVMAGGDIGRAIVLQWLVKLAYEVLATPLTYAIVNALKRAENEDYYDRQTDFNPFKFQAEA
jgi:queuosine precursor transporter